MLRTIRVRMRPRTPPPWPRRGATAGDFARCSSDLLGRWEHFQLGVGLLAKVGPNRYQAASVAMRLPVRFFGPSAAIAQLVEHLIRNEGVGGSSASCGTNFRIAKLTTRNHSDVNERIV